VLIAAAIAACPARLGWNDASSIGGHAAMVPLTPLIHSPAVPHTSWPANTEVMST
jgi:hypothetical protein